MKIKVRETDYEKVISLPAEKRRKPKKPSIIFRTLLKLLSAGDLKATDFTYQNIGMERLGRDEPCLILMNHSSFIDLKIASTVLYPKPFNIICTEDGFVGKGWLMRQLGCIPTKKFVTDSRLVFEMKYALKTLKSSILMYPEASYSFDGTKTPLPSSLGKCIKLLGVPVVMIKTYGAFSRDPLYNSLQLRKVKVSADIIYLLSPDEINAKSADDINAVLDNAFTVDSFKWQQENAVKIDEPFRAEGLNRVLYKCPHCLTEGKMQVNGTSVCCMNCGKEYELTEYGYMRAKSGETEFCHIPDWYSWERECVRNEIISGEYSLDVDVDIMMMVNTKCVYKVGSGRLTHGREGFSLVGCDGRLSYRQKPTASYSLYSDYFWYEIGDMICIGDKDKSYYCFPKTACDIVAKTRLAAEEMYKLEKAKIRGNKALTAK